MYEFQAAYVYGPSERYNNGRGLSVLSADLAHLEGIFSLYDRGHENYALQIRNLRTDEIVRSKGSLKIASQTMNAAFNRRKNELRV